MNDNKITVITVCYNAVKEIEKTILSVINQTYDKIEYIIVDGGSKDGTIDIIKKYESHIKIWVSEPDNGIYDAMNKGVRMASGKWINMMNAGDYFKDNNVLSEVFSDNNIEMYSVIYSNFELRYPNSTNKIVEASEATGELLHQACIYKKELHGIYGIYSMMKPIIASDYLFLGQIPSEQYYKTSTIIASYDMTGISNQGNWCGLQLLCLKYVFHKRSFHQLVKIFVKTYLKEYIPSPIINIYKYGKKRIKKENS